MLIACNSIEKHRSTIEALASDWASTTTNVTDFSNQLSGAVGNLNNMVGKMALSEDVMGGLNDEMKGKWDTAKGGVMQAIAGFGPIQSALGSFMKDWGENSSVVSSLTSGLEAGKIDPATLAKIPALQEMVAGAKDKLSGWQTGFADQNTKASSAMEQLKSVYDMIANK